MYFKKYHEFSDASDQAGGEFGQNQKFDSLTWGYMGCPSSLQENLTSYVKSNIKNMVFSRHLNTDNNANLVGMSFLKTKSQIQQNQFQMIKEKKVTDQSGNEVLSSVQSNMIIPFYKNNYGSNELQFDSVFESGNLALAIKVSDNEYNCILQNDINTNGHTQWFYFKVKSLFNKKTEVKINLINLYKPKSLYQYGMKILVLDVSKKEGFQESQDLPMWSRSGIDISYTQNRFTNEQCPSGLFQISFTYEFQKGEKEIYFAHSLPYTYTMLNQYLDKNVTKEKAKRQTLCHSLAGNKVEYLLITSKPKKQDSTENQYSSQNNSNVKMKEDDKIKETNIEAQNPSKKINPLLKRTKSLTKKEKRKPLQNETKPIEKQVIMITSRIHPGETNSSWMIQGLIDTLLNPEDEKEEELVRNLKNHFEIYIIPMLNVDGVINGNYRCSLAACDLNRKWIKPSKTLHPTVYYTKKLCQQITETEQKQFFLYLDLHGHSAKKNVFQFGNNMDGFNNNSKTKEKNQFVRHFPSTFPLVLSKQFDYFSFQECTFSMPKSKEATARVTMFQQLKIPFVFTLEASFAGASKGNLSGKHFSLKDQTNIGKYVLKAIWEVKKLELNKNLLKQINDEANLISKQKQDDQDDSDGCASSDEDTLAINNKKVIQLTHDQQEDSSPCSAIKKLNGLNEFDRSPFQGVQQLGKKPRFHFGSSSISQKQKYIGNKNIINLKTLQTPNENTGGQQGASPGKSQSPRKNDMFGHRNQINLYEKGFRNNLNGLMQPLRRSMNYQQNSQRVSQNEEGQSFSEQISKIQNQGTDKNSHIGSSPSGWARSSNISYLVNRPSEKEFKLELFKNLKQTERINSTSQQSNDKEPHNNQIQQNEQNSKPKVQNKPKKNQTNNDFQIKQQELFDQFNQEIKRSFEQQQQSIDQIFKQTANKFILNFQERQNQIHQSQHFEKYQKQKNDFEQYFSQQSTEAQKEQKQRKLTTREKINQGNEKTPQNLKTDNILQKQPAQIETLIKLKKLHQMQKLNQMAQMQFFKQQAELLLYQNLSHQQQFDLFQQFSMYQAQIQLQNQQYQILLNDSLQGNQIHQSQLNNKESLNTNLKKGQSQILNNQQDQINKNNDTQFKKSNYSEFKLKQNVKLATAKIEIKETDKNTKQYENQTQSQQDEENLNIWSINKKNSSENFQNKDRLIKYRQIQQLHTQDQYIDQDNNNQQHQGIQSCQIEQHQSQNLNQQQKKNNFASYVDFENFHRVNENIQNTKIQLISSKSQSKNFQQNHRVLKPQKKQEHNEEIKQDEQPIIDQLSQKYLKQNSKNQEFLSIRGNLNSQCDQEITSSRYNSNYISKNDINQQSYFLSTNSQKDDIFKEQINSPDSKYQQMQKKNLNTQRTDTKITSKKKIIGNKMNQQYGIYEIPQKDQTKDKYNQILNSVQAGVQNISSQITDIKNNLNILKILESTSTIRSAAENSKKQSKQAKSQVQAKPSSQQLNRNKMGNEVFDYSNNQHNTQIKEGNDYQNNQKTIYSKFKNQ